MAVTISGKQVNIFLGIIVSIILIVGAIYQFDKTYVSSAEFITYQKNSNREARRLFIGLYESQLDDIEFKIEQGTATNFEKAKKLRVERRIDQLQNNEMVAGAK